MSIGNNMWFYFSFYWKIRSYGFTTVIGYIKRTLGYIKRTLVTMAEPYLYLYNVRDLKETPNCCRIWNGEYSRNFSTLGCELKINLLILSSTEIGSLDLFNIFYENDTLSIFFK